MRSIFLHDNYCKVFHIDYIVYLKFKFKTILIEVYEFKTLLKLREGCNYSTSADHEKFDQTLVQLYKKITYTHVQVYTSMEQKI